MNWLKRITEYYRDKVLAAKCGLDVKDVCVHERLAIPDELEDCFVQVNNKVIRYFRCVKCREWFHE